MRQEAGPQSLFSTKHLEKVRETIGKNRVKAARGEDWYIWDSEIARHEATFSLILPDNYSSIRNLVRRKRAQGQGVIALDLMSYGHALRGLPNLRAGLSIGLTYRRTNEEYLEDEGHDRDVIDGDLLKPETWRKIKDWIGAKRPDDPYFDLITCRPVGSRTGNSFEDAQITYLINLRRVYRLLNPRDGVALLQCPDYFLQHTKTAGNVLKILNAKPEECVVKTGSEISTIGIQNTRSTATLGDLAFIS